MLGVVLIALTGQWGFFLLVVLGGIGVGLGFRLGQDGTERVERAEGLRRSLAREVEGATRRAASEYDAAQAGYAARVEDLESYRALRRQVG
ncbi:hypothetical protein G7085_16965 [Tessaracoccus sp. HDW20]|uniref:hypothetical protein n=1 Tax=Tessaracoccus coleopterorum TaxID=2714950 RepID=UPI0018D29CF0|nr:hypothetical protein [Tessaracoccus coleopterorum]NHB85712.1 hypothetical protein [Tessaracoccus coleopterorum]